MRIILIAMALLLNITIACAATTECPKCHRQAHVLETMGDWENAVCLRCIYGEEEGGELDKYYESLTEGVTDEIQVNSLVANSYFDDDHDGLCAAKNR